MESLAFEKHYRVRELAGLWGLSPKTVTRLFADETGVIRVANDATCKRKYATLSIPESVASRIHLRLAIQPLEGTFPGGGHPIRRIRLSDVQARTLGKPRNIVRVKPAPLLAHRENVSVS